MSFFERPVEKVTNAPKAKALSSENLEEVSEGESSDQVLSGFNNLFELSSESQPSDHLRVSLNRRSFLQGAGAATLAASMPLKSESHAETATASFRETMRSFNRQPVVEALKRGTPSQIEAVLKNVPTVFDIESLSNEEDRRYALGPFIMPDSSTRDVSNWPTVPMRVSTGEDQFSYLNTFRLSIGKIITAASRLTGSKAASKRDVEALVNGIDVAIRDHTVSGAYKDVPITPTEVFASTNPEALPVSIIGYRLEENRTWEPQLHTGVAFSLQKLPSLREYILKAILDSKAPDWDKRIAPFMLDHSYFIPLEPLRDPSFRQDIVQRGAPVFSFDPTFSGNASTKSLQGIVNAYGAFGNIIGALVVRSDVILDQLRAKK